LEKNKIEIVKEIKYFGIIFDEKLIWKPHNVHSGSKKSKLSSGSWALLKLKNYVDMNTLKVEVYYSLIYTYLQYCVSSWRNASKTALNSLEKLQNVLLEF